MIVCICHRVSDRDIARAASQGCNSFEDLQHSLRVATGCGRCQDCARATLQAHCQSAVLWAPAAGAAATAHA